MLGFFSLTSLASQTSRKVKAKFPCWINLFFHFIFYVDHEKGPAWEDWAREKSQDSAVKLKPAFANVEVILRLKLL